MIEASILQTSSLSVIDLHVISQLKGQIHAFQELYEIKQFLLDAEIEDDETHSSGTEIIS